MNAVATFRPLADRLPDGRIAVYVGACYSNLEQEASLQMFVQLADALDVQIPSRVRFRLWLAGLRVPPKPEAVSRHFHVSRATAYRWLTAERRARSRITA
jgi:hypothetical protein